ncbi:uncharacterized protein [Clytia hemisphaerica]|uniref:Uncharacterized protein n=1 Tax=Clytia hemisphaerica TaxID=252671 RepID=A0A7M5V5R5_9CNID
MAAHYAFIMYVNDVEIKRGIQKNPKTFKSVECYAGSKEKMSINGLVRNLKYNQTNEDFVVPSNFTLERGKIIETIRTWPKAWFVKVKFVLHSKGTNRYYGIFQFMNGTETCCGYGSRIPAMYVDTFSNNIHLSIVLLDSTSTKFHFTYNGEGIILDREYNFHIQSEPIQFEGQDIQKVWIGVDDVIVNVVFNYVNIDIENVDVYGSGTASEAADVTIKELDYGPVEFSGKLKGPRSYKIRRGFLINQIPIWPKEWFVKFKVIINTFDVGSSSYAWYNIIHFTEGANNNAYGTRVPSMFIHKVSQTMQLHFDYKGSDGIYRRKLTGQYPIQSGREYGIHVQSEEVIYQGENIHKIRVSIDGVEVAHVYNYFAEVFHNVNIYASNPWHGSMEGVIKDLEFGPLS